MIHIYTGDGKGKTTAAIGQAIRTAGNRIPVLFVQFLKDGSSGEIELLKSIPGIQVDYVEHPYGFYKNMTALEREDAREAYARLLHENIEKAWNLIARDVTKKEKNEKKCTTRLLVVLDEILASYEYQLICRETLQQFLQECPPDMEIILTGRNPGQELIEVADYVTTMKKIKHPFDQGIQARKGIEY